MLRVRVRVRVKIRFRVKIRVKTRVRVRVRHHKMFCMFRVRVKIRVRFRIRVRISIILKRCSSPVLAHPPLLGNRQLLASAECLDGIVPLASAHGCIQELIDCHWGC